MQKLEVAFYFIFVGLDQLHGWCDSSENKGCLARLDMLPPSSGNLNL
jgi:hypothetical protein